MKSLPRKTFQTAPGSSTTPSGAPRHTYGFRILFSGGRDEIEDLSEDLCARLSRLARGFYNAADRERKGIQNRDYKTGNMEVVPLVSFTAELSYYGS